ncbi:biotin--[acetyl-CoA-carboxylase] ligase [uncultured Flavobacterium sp.]|uniref:biotin--[acetyl-CoA-carboxylase] ligase n=1 Tax=uncultured Flavobacterium sp. TaxID=165435 RepID=UPI0030ECA44A|tara:strand:- start:38309 stop:39037 length:729 start_codon:yes stop_codon:yes gene_type:complete
MNIIKLNATNSTNDYLKDLMRKQFVDNFTIVVANNQEKGRGQRDAEWLSESGKNLTFSVLVRDLIMSPTELFTLNIAVALSVFETLNQLTSKKCAVKWPNDIMADNKKIAGILIENAIQQNGEIYSVIGIGINVNQINFNSISNVTSLKLLENLDFNLDNVLNVLLENLKQTISLVRIKSDLLWKNYLDNLFKKEIPTTFEDANQQKFMGIIKGVSSIGQLQVLLEDDSIKNYGIKEIKMLY